MKFKNILLLAFFLPILGCSKPDLTQYQGRQPELDLFDYFMGETTGWGMVQDRGGNLTRQFVVRITGTLRDENTLVLDEYFDWSDGEKSTRVWTVSREGANSFTGSAGDVEGTASGSVYGNVLNWRYYLNIEVDGRTWKIHLDDWMFLQPDRVLINKAEMSKFGIHLGDITIVFLKDDSGGDR